MTVQDLPAINATLNGLSTVLLLCGWYLIRMNRTKAHVLVMCAALLTSTLFLTCYLIYHLNVVAVTRFTGQGLARTIYFAVLISHTILAMIVLPLVIGTVVPALRAHYERHRWIARWTLPLWLYVSITGVIVYMMLYQWFPSAKYAVL